MSTIPDSRLEEFAQLCVDGLALKDLAAHFGCPIYVASRTKKKLGLARTVAAPGTHGASLYRHGKCKCEVCTAANRELANRNRAKREAEPKDPNDPRHGKVSFYRNHGCRCEPCTEANNVACRDYDRRRAAA